MQQPPEQEPISQKRKRLNYVVQRMGKTMSNGDLLYPEKTLAEVAAALCQQTTAEGMQGVYELVIEAVRARPEFANMRMYSIRTRSSYNGAYDMIVDNDPETQEKVRSDTLPSSTHRDPEQMTQKLIYARFMWKLWALLERNLAARQILVPQVSRNEPLSNQLPVPMQSFCQSEETWWELIRQITRWIYSIFGGSYRLSTQSDSAEAVAIRRIVSQYRQQHGLRDNSEYEGQANETKQGLDRQPTEGEVPNAISAEASLVGPALHQYQQHHCIRRDARHRSDAGETEEVRGVHHIEGSSQRAVPVSPRPVQAQEADVVQCSPS